METTIINVEVPDYPTLWELIAVPVQNPFTKAYATDMVDLLDLSPSIVTKLSDNHCTIERRNTLN